MHIDHISSVAKSAARKIDWLLIQVQAIFHALALSHPLSTRPKSAPVSNTALIYGEEPLNIPLLPWVQFKTSHQTN